MLESVSRELDIRDRWLGIRQMKKQFAPNPYCRKDERGRHIPKDRLAEETAKFLAEEVWGGGHIAQQAGEVENNAREIWGEEDYPDLFPVVEGEGIDVPLTPEEVQQSADLKGEKRQGRMRSHLAYSKN